MEQSERGYQSSFDADKMKHAKMHKKPCLVKKPRLVRPGGLSLTLCACVLLSACASFSPDGGMNAVQAIVSNDTHAKVVAIRDDADEAFAHATVQRLLKSTLTADSAVQLAFLNNRALQAAYNELAIAEAVMVGESLPPNPTFSLSKISGTGSSELELQAALDLLALATLPARSEIAAGRFRQAQLRAVAETLRTALDVRRAYYRATAARELVTLLTEAEHTAKATAQLAKNLGETGSLSKLDQAREQLLYAETSADLGMIRRDAASAREHLIQLLGLWGDEAAFRLPNGLPRLPSRVSSLPSVEVDAISRRVDIKISRLELDTLAKSYGLTKATRFISLVEAAGVTKTTKDPEVGRIRESGAQAQIQIPLFDFGEVRVRQAEQAYAQAINRLTDLAIRARSEARDAYRTYRANYDLATHYQREVLPLRKIITEEDQLRFGAMQTDIFALLLDERQRVATLRTAIEAKKAFWLADTNLNAAIVGAGSSSEIIAAATPATGMAIVGGH